MSDDSNDRLQQKSNRKQKKQKKENIDQDFWTEDQKLRYREAKTQLEKEKIMDEVKQKLEDENYRNQVIKMSHKPAGSQMEEESYNDYSSESLDNDSQSDQSRHASSEEGEIGRKKSKNEIETQIKQEQNIDSYEQAIRNIVLKRNQIDYFLMKRYYDDVIEGAFVRIQEPSLKCYALAQILAIMEAEKPYQLEQSTTHKLIKLQFAQISQPKYRHITLVSNQPVESQEYIVWKKLSEEKGHTLPKVEDLHQKHNDVVSEIQKAFQTKMTDEQIERKIVSLMNRWISQEKQNIQYQDLPVFLHFMQNQNSIQQQKIDKLDESIQEIQDSVDGSEQLTQDDKSKTIDLQRQKQECRQRMSFLSQEIEKIQNLFAKNLQKQKSKLEEGQKQKMMYIIQCRQNIQYNQSQQNQNYQQNQPKEKKQQNDQYEKMKQLDQAYNGKKQFDNMDSIANSDGLKLKFIEMHKRELKIDGIIEEMIEID